MEQTHFETIVTDQQFDAANLFMVIIAPNSFLFELPSKLPLIGRAGLLISFCLYPAIVALQFGLCLLATLLRLLKSTGSLVGNLQMLAVYPFFLAIVWAIAKGLGFHPNWSMLF